MSIVKDLSYIRTWLHTMILILQYKAEITSVIEKGVDLPTEHIPVKIFITLIIGTLIPIKINTTTKPFYKCRFYLWSDIVSQKQLNKYHIILSNAQSSSNSKIWINLYLYYNWKSWSIMYAWLPLWAISLVGYIQLEVKTDKVIVDYWTEVDCCSSFLPSFLGR